MFEFVRIPLLAVVLSGALALGACGDGDNGSGGGSGGSEAGTGSGGSAAGIVVDWKVAEATGPGAETNKGTAYKFDKDGNALLGGFNKCTYTHTAPDLEISCGGVAIKWKTELKDDSTLVLTNEAEQVLTLKRE